MIDRNYLDGEGLVQMFHVQTMPVIPPKWPGRESAEAPIFIDGWVPYKRTQEEQGIAKRLGLGEPVIRGHFIVRVGEHAPMQCTLLAIERGPRLIALPDEYYLDHEGWEPGGHGWPGSLSYWGHEENRRLHDRILEAVERMIAPKG